MSIGALETYDASAECGFLSTLEAAGVRLSGAWGEAQETAMTLPRLLPTGRVRALLEALLPDPGDRLPGAGRAPIKIAFRHYSFLVQAYVWGEPEAPRRLPRKLAVPIVALADALGQKPLLTYSAYVLDNWSRIDPEGPISLDNIFMVQPFLGGQDEAWFVLVHVAIEARAGEALGLIAPLIEAAGAGEGEGDEAGVLAGLQRLARVWADVNALFDRMPERCDPYIYFERVRPYIHGWKDNPALPDGLVYEGVEAFGGRPQAFRGQTGSQSSIVPVMDALLGVGHAADPLRVFLDELHAYRPPGHRRLIEEVRAASRLRAFVEARGPGELAAAYNAVVQAVADFRSRHLEYAASYIHRQGRRAPGNDTDVGTGGTPFMKYLKKHRDETAASLLPE